MASNAYFLRPWPNVCRRCFGSEYGAKFRKDVDKDCKKCNGQFAVARWISDDATRKTEICHSCSQLENICQVCGEVCRKTRNGVFLPIRVDEEPIQPSTTSTTSTNRQVIRITSSGGAIRCHAGRIKIRPSPFDSDFYDPL